MSPRSSRQPCPRRTATRPTSPSGAAATRSPTANVDREVARRRLRQYRGEYEPDAQALAETLALALPPWSRRDDSRQQERKLQTFGTVAARDLVSQPAAHGTRRGPRRARI